MYMYRYHGYNVFIMDPYKHDKINCVRQLKLLVKGGRIFLGTGEGQNNFVDINVMLF